MSRRLVGTIGRFNCDAELCGSVLVVDREDFAQGAFGGKLLIAAPC